jgi:hypothetical protein
MHFAIMLELVLASYILRGLDASDWQIILGWTEIYLYSVTIVYLGNPSVLFES